MLGSAVFRTGVAPGGALAGPWVRNPLWTAARAVPSLDLRFADNKSLVDAVSGQNLVTFTRASSGTYVDSQGVIRTATTNLLLRSEEFDNAYWTKNNSCTITQNDTAAPNGTLTADRFNGAALSFTGVYVFPTTISGLVYTFSVYVKNLSGATSLRLGIESNPVNAFVIFNAATGVISSQGANVTSSSVQATGDGWYRVAVTYTATGSSAGVVIYSTSGLVATWYTWGAQLEQSSTVGEYIPTTSTINSAPRFDHNPTTGESLGLLVEEQRTNLLLHSACDSNWPSGGFGTATYNLGLSALGVFSGVQIASAGQNWHSIYRTGISLTASTVYAFTLFYRAGTSGRVRLTFRNNTTSTETVINGLAGNLSVSGSFAGAATVLSQFLCLDGLTYVVTGTFTPNGTSVDHWYRIGPDSTTSGQTVIALGGQLEAGSFPTSYIPTTTAAATRSADVASITGSNFSSWYRQDEGTVFAEFTPRTFAQACGLLSIDDGTTSERLQTRLSTNGNGAFVVADSGSIQVNFTTAASTSLNTKGKLATSFAVNSFKASLNGGSVASDASGTLPTVTQAVIGNAVGAFVFNGPLSRITFWPKELSESTLQGITQ